MTKLKDNIIFSAYSHLLRWGTVTRTFSKENYKLLNPTISPHFYMLAAFGTIDHSLFFNLTFFI